MGSGNNNNFCSFLRHNDKIKCKMCGACCKIENLAFLTLYISIIDWLAEKSLAISLPRTLRHTFVTITDLPLHYPCLYELFQWVLTCKLIYGDHHCVTLSLWINHNALIWIHSGMYTHLLLVACRLHTNSNIVGVSDLNNFRSYRSKYMTNFMGKTSLFCFKQFCWEQTKKRHGVFIYKI